VTDYSGMFADHSENRDRRMANGGYLVDILAQYFDLKSVIDLGCGLGFFLAAMQARGADVQAVDGDWVTPLETEIDKSHYIVADLNKPFSSTARYDLAASLEVAEHLEPARSEAFVAELCALSDIVLFSAGIPGQGGTGHINLRWQDEWAEMFAANGYACFDAIRRKMVAHADALPWFKQNVLLFVKDGVPIPALLDEHRIVPAAAAYIIKGQHNRRTRRLHEKIIKLRKKNDEPVEAL
jgi:SAM-dependent methyltransferase